MFARLLSISLGAILVENFIFSKFLPFFSLGMGWVVPACIGLAIGLVLHVSGKKAA